MKRFIMMTCICVASFAAGLYVGPKHVETREVEKVVYREREVKDEKRDVTKRRVKTRLPDGTVTTETITEDKSTVTSDKQSDVASVVAKAEVKESRPDWRVGAVYFPLETGVYGIQVERRLFSEIYLGGTYATDGRIGVILTIGF